MVWRGKCFQEMISPQAFLKARDDIFQFLLSYYMCLDNGPI
jgi:hypothetical protein